MAYARRSPSSFDSCPDLPDLISPEDIDKHPLTLNSCTWDSELTTNSLVTNQVTYAWTWTASSPTMLLSEIRARMIQKFPGPYFKRTSKWKESLQVYLDSKIKSKL
ncbi:hypothetical protein EXIGLDRAFT_756262 [Exidia glandulosa HHB12029]|uniref:Uncharacterized protein n=1 Tax=Exidia glandulosa HHB12029 TaxID=1314781 RepID=A0A165BDP5_EXIGL|nr:hypothetical protein EXIGLDRAFT_756262 [Exidia glandulosa HHB12029]